MKFFTSLIRNVLLCFIFLTVFLAVPVQSQTSTPLPCELGVGPTISLSAGTTYSLTRDCVITETMPVPSGEVTLNGNGHSIIGPNSVSAISIISGATLNLNDITIRGAGAANSTALEVTDSTLDARNVVFRDNPGYALAVTGSGSTARLTNAQFLNNGPGDNTERGSAITVWGAGNVANINGAVFSGNSGFDQVIRVNIGTVTIRGCIRASGNTDADGQPAELVTGRSDVTINDDRGSCPKRKKKEKIPTATPTPRPLAVTCPALSQATGIIIQATYGAGSGVQCQRIGGGGIGIQSIIDAGFIDAVDIWGYVEQGVEVCFPQAGHLLFLDARAMPRAIAPLESTVVNGMTCAAITTPGSIVLMPS